MTMCTMHYKRMKRGAPMDGPPRLNTPGTMHERVSRRLPDEFNPAECYEWAGGRDENGYGITTAGSGSDRRQVRVTRVVFEMFNGPMPDGAEIIMHVCDNPPCVNPHHLVAGTRTLNMVDKIEKGRQSSILTADQVLAIRADPRLLAQIAADYGVSVPTISAIRTRRTWAWLD